MNNNISGLKSFVSGRRRTHQKFDVVLDTDTYNEIDDLYALAYVILSKDVFNVSAIIAAPFYSPKCLNRVRTTHSPREGMEESYQAIINLLKKMKREDLKRKVFKGVQSFLPDETHSVDSPGVNEIIRLAKQHTSESPLFIIGIAVLTDIASAIIKDPSIIDKIVVIWLGGNAIEKNSCSDFNASQDIAAARVVFRADERLVQLPCSGVVSDFSVTRADLIKYLQGKNELCSYLLKESLDFLSLKYKTDDWIKPLWDVTAAAWAVSDDFMDSKIIPSPEFQYNYTYKIDKNRNPITYVYRIHRNALMNDMFSKLAKAFD